jgi:hypothetical protein
VTELRQRLVPARHPVIPKPNAEVAGGEGARHRGMLSAAIIPARFSAECAG